MNTMNAGNEITVPGAAVAIDGVGPEAGDEVEVTLRGRVSAVRGDSVVFTASEANGVPMVAAAAGVEPDMGDADLSEEQLREVAGAYDRGPRGVEQLLG